MIRFRFKSVLAGIFVLAFGPAAVFGAASQVSDFQEVYSLIRSQAAGVSEAELNEAAIQGLVQALGSKASIITNGQAARTEAEAPLADARVFENEVAYFRVRRVGSGLEEAVRGGYGALDATNDVKGVVLDLRYAGGNDFNAAARTADLFLAKAQPLLQWDDTVASSRAKTNAITRPVAVLVNRETAGAAEALAAVLRESGAGLILGSRTAGRAMVTQDFPLKNGATLRIATAPLTLGDGAKLPMDGLTPDIQVTVPEEHERAYYANAFHVVHRTNALAGGSGPMNPNGTNASRRVRFSEADLVREHRNGLNGAAEPLVRPEAEPDQPVVHDPALARAIDLLRGLALVRRSRS